jgi:HPt (histidine-containing phosphotransfer) domain-containing protein
MSEEKFYRLDQLKELADGNQEFILEMVQLFIKNTGMVMKDMEAAIHEKNKDRLRRLAHSIKSNIRTYGIHNALESILFLEKDQAEPQWEEIQRQFSLFRGISEKAMDQMREEFSLS